MVSMTPFAVASAFDPRPLEDGECHRRIAIEIGIGRIVLRREFDAGRRP